MKFLALCSNCFTYIAVDGVHSVHLRVGAKDIAFRQFQRHLHIVGSQAVGQQQPHAGVGYRMAFSTINASCNIPR